MIKIGSYEGRDYPRTDLTLPVQQRPDGLYVRVRTRHEVTHPGKESPFSYDNLAVGGLLEAVQQDIARIEQASQAALEPAGAIALKPQLSMQHAAATKFKSQLEVLVRRHSGAKPITPSVLGVD